MDLGIIIQARTSSTRLPGKVLKPFFEDKCILQLQVEELRRAFPNTKIVVATSVNQSDQKIEELCTQMDIHCFRGSENDVLNRFNLCAQELQVNTVVRVCSDNPFLLGLYVQTLLSKFKDLDYLSFRSAEGTPAIKMHWGLFAEIVSVEALQKAERMTSDKFYHEHVTNYIYGNPKTFNVELLDAPACVFNRSDLRFTIDTEMDFKLTQMLYPNWDKTSLEQLVALADENNDALKAMKEGIDQFSK